MLSFIPSFIPVHFYFENHDYLRLKTSVISITNLFIYSYTGMHKSVCTAMYTITIQKGENILLENVS